MQSLEKYIMANYKDNQTYLKLTGYKAFYSQMVLLKKNNIIKEIASSMYNGYNPPLKTKWQILSQVNNSTWDKVQNHLNYLTI